jgi:hypothetical protein
MKWTLRHFLLPVIVSAPLVVAIAAPAQAGFWENLFGVEDKKPAASPEPPRNAEAPVKQARPKSSMRDGADNEKRRIAANLALKAAQAGKDPAVLAFQDNTLRRGDIVSGPNGLMVYMGGDPESPGDAQFLAANDPNLERRLRETLQGLKRPNEAPAAPEASGQAQPVAAQPSAEPIEHDARTVRVVGANAANAAPGASRPVN